MPMARYAAMLALILTPPAMSQGATEYVSIRRSQPSLVDVSLGLRIGGLPLLGDLDVLVFVGVMDGDESVQVLVGLCELRAMLLQRLAQGLLVPEIAHAGAALLANH
eukprot:6816244-Alexandrium_andersonii.AAC.1